MLIPDTAEEASNTHVNALIVVVVDVEAKVWKFDCKVWQRNIWGEIKRTKGNGGE